MALLALSGLQAGCFSGVKHVREGEPCVAGDQVFSGDVACGEALVCYRDGSEGICTRTCVEQSDCAPDRVCATGVCLQPCSEACAFSFPSSGVCCQLPDDGVSACLPTPACADAGGAYP